MQMLLVVKHLSRHDGFRAEGVQNSSLHGEEIKKFNGIQYNVNGQKLWDPVEWETVPSGSAMLLNHPDAAFDLGDMFICAHEIEHWTTWHGSDQRLEQFKFCISMHGHDSKTMMEIILIDPLLEHLEYLWDSPVSQMVHCCEAYLVTQHEEEGYLVDKENVGC